jgi:hypothetical protein
MADDRYATRGPLPRRVRESLVANLGPNARVKTEADSAFGQGLPWDVRLMRHLIGSVNVYLVETKLDTAISAEFLAALTANESGGDPRASRFEPGVYQHLKSVAEGRATRYGSIDKSLLDKRIEQEKGSEPTAVGSLPAVTGDRPVNSGPQTATTNDAKPAGPQTPAPAKTDSYHAEHLTAAFSTSCAPALSALEDAAIRRLATSWGLTQIMGYHMLGRPEPVEKLCDPAFHYRLAVRMIEDFAARFHLDPKSDFEALFRCWNTGRPDGKTFDPSYAERGIRRIEICRQFTAAETAQDRRSA